jgi:hypothetical protein
MTQYLDNTLINGKWYISEGFRLTRNPTPESREKTRRHNQGAHRMVVAGPFETRQFADGALFDLRNDRPDVHEPFVWQSRSTEDIFN